MSTAELTVQSPVADVSTDELIVIARSPGEMQEAQAALSKWFEGKIAIVAKDADDATENLRIAIENRFKAGRFERLANLAKKRVDYYTKCKAAIDAGYCIVPNFPVDVFAIRTTRKTPDKMDGTSEWRERRQSSNSPEIGEGRNLSDRPIIYEKNIPEGKNEKGEVRNVMHYFAKEFDPEIEFPVAIVKPQIMNATANALAMKIFDEVGALPARRSKGDPIVVGFILDPRSASGDRKGLTFLISWWIDTRDL
jgi:hypothetical protein